MSGEFDGRVVADVDVGRVRKPPPTALKGVPKPPKGLSGAAAAFWKATVSVYDLEPHALILLEHACRTLDRLTDARATVDAEGATFTDRFGQPQSHPAARQERDLQVLLARLVRELALGDGNAPEDARVPRPGGRPGRTTQGKGRPRAVGS